MAVDPDTAVPIVRSLIPARLDRLPWTRFHTRLIMALGTAGPVHRSPSRPLLTCVACVYPADLLTVSRVAARGRAGHGRLPRTPLT